MGGEVALERTIEQCGKLFTPPLPPKKMHSVVFDFSVDDF